MRHTTIALVLLTASATGCSAAKAAMGLLSPKPAQVTVVNTITAPPAPAPVVVTVQQPEAPKPRTGRATAMVVGGAAGALFGGLIGKALDQEVVSAAAIGGGVGAVTGLIVHELDD